MRICPGLGQEELFALGAPATHLVPIKDHSGNLSIPRWVCVLSHIVLIPDIKNQWVCQEAERWRESRGGRSLPRWWDFALLKAELCQGCPCLQQQPQQSLGKPPRLIQELEMLLQRLNKGRRSHTQHSSLLCQGGICLWPNGTIAAPKFTLLSWGTRTGKVPTACGLYQSR